MGYKSDIAFFPAEKTVSPHLEHLAITYVSCPLIYVGWKGTSFNLLLASNCFQLNKNRGHRI